MLRLGLWAQAFLVLPGRPRPDGGRLRWLGWGGRALLGMPARVRADGLRQRWPWWLARTSQGLLVRVLLLVAAFLGAGLFLLRGSLPRLDGTFSVPGLSAAVRIERDGQAIPSIHASNRADLACGLGFVHAQDRFFQMDLLRRYAAGELAELLGPTVLEADRQSRLHRFRALARRALAGLDSASRAELEAYVRGVNAGYDSLRVRPFEYLLLRTTPEPWQAEDSVLVMLSMFLMLQEHDFAVESALGVAKDTLPDALYQLLSAQGDEWDAPLEGLTLPTPPLPGPDVFDLRKERVAFPMPPEAGLRTLLERCRPGSNSWAVDGAHSTQGGAILANDMHLGLRLPNIWYRAGLAWTDGKGRPRRAWGATLPGGPGLIIGSNGQVAWGLTNSGGDWSDLVRLELDPSDAGRYRTPAGWRPFETFQEIIHVKGAADVPRPVRWTQWGPVLDDTAYHERQPLALRWVAHDAEVLSLRYLDLLEANSLEEAITTATCSTGPQCNFLAADAGGSIGWTIYGRIPRRIGFDGRTPTSWADGTCHWAGYVDPAEAPRILRPADGFLWTANNRVVAGAKLALLGTGGYDRGARAGQIRDRLRARKKLSEADMLAIQLDDRALFLARWQKLLLEVLSGPWAADAEHAELRRLVTDWGGRAAAASAGFRMVHSFRLRVGTAVLAPLTVPCRQIDATISAGLFRSQEGAVWRILQERPPHLLDPRYPTWDHLLRAVVDEMLQDLRRSGPDLTQRTWGEQNVTRLRHPFSPSLRELPVAGGPLADWLGLDMPALVLDGGWTDMPHVQMAAFGASQRMAVSPGREIEGYFHMPGGQSGHPLSPHYRDGQDAWALGWATSFLPGETAHVLVLE
jgi:penicillin amidase